MTIRSRLFLPLFLVLLTACGSVSSPTVTTDSTGAVIPPTTPGSTAAIAATATEIQSEVSGAVLLALSGYGYVNATEAKAVASQVATICNGTIVPYLNQANGVTSDVINTAMQENFVTLPTAVLSLITMLGGVLDSYLPIPKAGTFLTQTELAYASAFFTGLANGCKTYASASSATASKVISARVSFPWNPNGGHWMNFIQSGKAPKPQ